MIWAKEWYSIISSSLLEMTWKIRSLLYYWYFQYKFPIIMPGIVLPALIYSDVDPTISSPFVWQLLCISLYQIFGTKYLRKLMHLNHEMLCETKIKFCVHIVFSSYHILLRKILTFFSDKLLLSDKLHNFQSNPHNLYQHWVTGLLISYSIKM